MDAESDRLVGTSAGTGLVGVRTSKERHGRLDPEDINISKPGEKMSEQTPLQNGETIVEVIEAIQQQPRSGAAILLQPLEIIFVDSTGHIVAVETRHLEILDLSVLHNAFQQVLNGLINNMIGPENI